MLIAQRKFEDVQTMIQNWDDAQASIPMHIEGKCVIEVKRKQAGEPLSEGTAITWKTEESASSQQRSHITKAPCGRNAPENSRKNVREEFLKVRSNTGLFAVKSARSIHFAWKNQTVQTNKVTAE